MGFQGSGRGWTESYVYDSQSETHGDAMFALRRLASRRCLLLGQECVLNRLRVSEQSDGPDAHIAEVNYRTDREETAAEPDVTLVLRLASGNLRRWKHTFLRGIWDRVEDSHGTYIGRAIPAWRDRIDPYMQELFVEAWHWWGVTGKSRARITNYTTDANERVSFALDRDLFAADDVGKNKVVRVSRVNNSKSRVNRQHVIEVLTRSTCRTFDPFAAGLFRTGGFMTLNTMGPIKIVNVFDRYIGTRKVGAPFLHSPGHAPRAPRI